MRVSNDFFGSRQSKYGNRKTTVDGYVFDSKKEANYYLELKMQMNAVSPHQRVVEIELQPSFVLQKGFIDRNGKKHLPIKYLADFRVKYADGREQIVDVKGAKTDVYKLKKKMLLFQNPEMDFIEI